MKAEQNALLTQIGPGTACGAVLRSYWQPVALVDEFDPAQDPRMALRPVKAVRALGQDLVLFRDGQSRWGLLDRNCPHRGADLAFGRHEGDGLRCPFHGWKFDTTGRCLETPAEPVGSKLCERVTQRSYPVLERSGVLFAWFGESGAEPPFPLFDCFAAPATHVFAFKGMWQCNWLQAFEVGIDPAHPSFLHRFLNDTSLDEVGSNAGGRQFRSASAGDVLGERWPMTRIMREFHRPDISFEARPWGFQLTALRPMTDELTHVRVTQEIFPSTFVIPLSETLTITQMHVPIDDTHTYWYSFFTSFAEPVNKQAMRDQRTQFIPPPLYIPKSGRDNDWGFNPEEQRTTTYLGMGEDDINVHDQWAVEGMGAVQDRTREHLGTTDKVIMANRRLLLKAIEGVQAGRTAPGVADPALAEQMRGPDTVDGIAPAGTWSTWWKARADAKREGAPWTDKQPWKSSPRENAGPMPGFCRSAGREPATVSHFAARCGIHDAARERAVKEACSLIQSGGAELVRVSWCDLHGISRSKALTARAAETALRSGVSMVSTLMLKDLSGRTPYRVFEPGGTDTLPGFGQANNLMLLPDPTSFRILPWAESTGWLRADPWFTDGLPVGLDPRRVLQHALAQLHARGLAMRCGLEVEFHIYRIEQAGQDDDPADAAAYGGPSKVRRLHSGTSLLDEGFLDRSEEPLRIVQRTAQALGMPLLSLEAEMGPSQVEAVFDVTDAMTAADNMALFRNATRMALRRAGYHATFMCRPPFPNIMSSGWHLHQSLVSVEDGRNLFRRDSPAPDSTPRDAGYTLSEPGEHYLAGLLHHALGATVFCTPTVNGFGRFRPNALAPQSVVWGRDSRGAMLRVIGGCGDEGTRIENRIGEPAANPYLYLASQIHSGLDGMTHRMKAPRASEAPYGAEAPALPASLSEGLAALQADAVLTAAIGQPFVDHFVRIKNAEVQRYEEAVDKDEFQRTEYFGRI